MRSIRFLALLGLVLLVTGCVVGGTSKLEPYPDLIQPFGVVAPGEEVEAMLATTSPNEVEEDPRLILDVTFFDELTGVELIGDVEVFKRGHSDSVSCRKQIRCVIALRPTGQDSTPWVIEVRVAGYLDQMLELKGNTLSSRTLTMPMQMRPAGLEG